MGFLDELRSWFRKESADAREWAQDAVRDGDAALDRAERRLSASPEERLQASVEDLQANDDAFAAIRARADAAAARPLAERELAEGETAEPDLATDDPSPGTAGTAGPAERDGG